MKVLIETITNRKGYEFFENKEEMDDFLGNHCKNIVSYEILQEEILKKKPTKYSNHL